MENTLDKQEYPQAQAKVEGSPQTSSAGGADADDGIADERDPSGPAGTTAEKEIAATVEAILFSADSPLSPAKIALVAELPGRAQVKNAIRRLNERYERLGSAFRIESIAGGYQMLTQPEYHDVIGRLFKNKSDSKLSQAALETLAIIAYRQPILRADIEAVRGVASGEMLRKLLDKNLVKIVGRAEVLGRPMLYGTTRRFLEVFGLNSIDDLPNVESLRGGRDATKGAEQAGEPTEKGDTDDPAKPGIATEDKARTQHPQPASPRDPHLA